MTDDKLLPFRRPPNVSAAVLQQRHEIVDSPTAALDDFPTQPWAGRALADVVLRKRLAPSAIDALQRRTVLEPAANRGYLVRALSDYFGPIYSSDVHDYGWPGLQAICDFIAPQRDMFRAGGLDVFAAGAWDWIITNPPFEDWDRWALRCLELKPRSGFALLARTTAVEGAARYNRIWRRHPPSVIAHFAERLNLVHGCVDPQASRPTAYTWFVWIVGQPSDPDAIPTMIIPPGTKARLEQPADYVDRCALQEDIDE